MANEEHLAILKQGVKKWNQWRKEYLDVQGVLPDLSWANLAGLDLREVDLRNTDLSGVDLEGANFEGAILGGTIFARIDLSKTIGLDAVTHLAPSSIGIDTIYLSQGKIPEVFLRGCGVPDDFITFMHSFVAGQPIQFYSCFISHSTKDDEFVRRLHADLQAARVRVWFAPEDLGGGKKLHEQLYDAIRLHDKLLLVLSPNSLQSEWVMTEIRRTRKLEVEGKRRKLFPIRLADWDTIRNWECFDADTGKDLVIEVREYYVPDFSNWKDHDSYKKAFDRLLRDLAQSENGTG